MPMRNIYKNDSGNILIIILILAVILIALFFILPVGGSVGQIRESAISFILRTPPRFISIEVKINDEPIIIRAGQSLLIHGNENLIITNINANTFFKSYLNADIEGFGKQSELNQSISTTEIRNQLIDTGIRSIPIDIYYISRVIAKVPIEIEVSEDDFLKQLKTAKNTNEQITILKNAFNTFPQNNFFLKQLEDSLINKGDLQGLINIYKKQLENDGYNESILTKLTNLYIRLGLLDDAEKLNLNIITSNKQTASTYYRLALIAGVRSDLNKKISYLEDGLLIDRTNNELLLELGKTYEQKGDKTKALELYKSISYESSSKEVLIAVIQDAVKKKDYETAEPLLKRYVSLYPTDKNAVALLGKIMGSIGDPEAQVEYYKKALALSPNDPVVMFNLGIAYEKAGNIKEALNTYNRLLKIKPGDPDTLSRVSSLYLKQGRNSEAYKHFSMLTGLKETKENLRGLVESSYAMNDSQKTINACKKYLGKYQDYDVALILARTLEKVADTKTGRIKAKYVKDAIDAYITTNNIKQTDAVEQKIIDLSKERRQLLKDLR
jgi:tetratricopeptide (TPR) repeat protein